MTTSFGSAIPLDAVLSVNTPTEAVALLETWAQAAESKRLPGGWGGQTASHAAHLRKCARELALCADPHGACEVLSRYAALAHGAAAGKLQLLARQFRSATTSFRQ